MMVILQKTWALMVKLKEQEEASRAIAMAALPSPSSTASPTPPQRATLPLAAPLVHSPRRIAAIQRWYFPCGRPTPCPRRCGAQRLRGQRHRRVLPAIITLRGNTGVTASPCRLPMSSGAFAAGGLRKRSGGGQKEVLGGSKMVYSKRRAIDLAWSLVVTGIATNVGCACSMKGLSFLITIASPLNSYAS